MSSPARLLKLGQTMAGSILACDVVDGNGRVLSTQGAELHEDIVKELSSSGIGEVWTLASTPQGIAESVQSTDTPTLQQQDQRLSRLFRHSNSTEDVHFLELMQRYRRARQP